MGANKTNLNTKTYFGDDLRDYPECPEDFKNFVEIEKHEVQQLIGDEKYKRMSRLAAHCRILNNFIEAHQFFSAASLCFKGKSPRMEMINNLRWADVFRFEKRFDEAWIILKKVEQSILANQFIDHQDFYLQHLGKFYFEKQDYAKALENFEQALELRLKKADQDLISSTEFAIKITKQRTGIG